LGTHAAVPLCATPNLAPFMVVKIGHILGMKRRHMFIAVSDNCYVVGSSIEWPQTGTKYALMYNFLFVLSWKFHRFDSTE